MFLQLVDLSPSRVRRSPGFIVLALAGLLLVLLVGCSTASRVVRLDTGKGKPLVVTPRGGEPPVQLREGEFKASLAELAREVRPVANPLQHARRLMFDSLWHEEVFLTWTGRRLELDPEGETARRAAQACLSLTHDYGRWCERQGRSRDCLSLLKQGPVLDADGRYVVAMELALGVVWNETREAFKDMASPEAVQATLVSAMAMYLMLWSIPEPASKGLAASLTAGLIAYLGVDTVWSLIQGWRLLVAEADQATTFAELRAAGERFGRVMGKNSARVFILLTTAAIGNTAGLAVKGPGLPGAAQAAVLAESQAGFRWAAVGEVRSVAVSAEGSFTIALAPGAVAMSAQGPGGGGTSSGTTSVYVSRNQVTEEVQYVGITDDIARRSAEQLRQKGIPIQRFMENLSRKDARAVEQALIEIHGLRKNGGTLLNHINSIARSNPKYAEALRRGLELLESIGYTGK
ncbi:SitA5 family polymorphic toxin [Archangium violaceum]|uniref:SitA5 family polymorphic toxin n=1 Tax=Archangium violaceum TaxID=83451 RepID=UPI0036DBAAAE